MSRLSAKNRPAERGSAGQSRPYNLIALNFHGSCLEPLRNEFVKRIRIGLRRHVFVIDLNEDENRAKKPSSITEAAHTNRGPRDFLLTTLAGIEQCRREYDTISQIINKERNFNILKYWMESDSSGPMSQSTAKPNKQPSVAGGKKPSKITAKLSIVREIKSDEEVFCPRSFSRTHTKVGKGEPLSKRKYIEDEPIPAKLYIVLLGKDSKELYLDLLRHSQPLQAIVHFVPQECAYDLLLPNPRTEAFAREQMEYIQNAFYNLREPKLPKPTGLFHQQLPVISRCLAQKLSKQIFDELTWYLYDLEVLNQHYRRYYVNAYHETNVSMPDSVRVEDLRETAESLSIQGHFLKAPLPGAATDVANVVMFLESLISTVESPEDLLTDLEYWLLATPVTTRSVLSIPDQTMNSLTMTYANAFHSITKLKKHERLIVEHNNKLLRNLVTYMDLNKFGNIYSCCLEYNILRRYLIPSIVEDVDLLQEPEIPQVDADGEEATECDREIFTFPTYCKFYPHQDGVIQRLRQLLNEYDDHEEQVLPTGQTLHHFWRHHNEVIDRERLIVIPTCLCFRDFTLFQMDMFLRDLVTPEIHEKRMSERRGTEELQQVKLRETHVDYDPSIFIRLNSLKAQKLRNSIDEKLMLMEKRQNEKQRKEEIRRTLAFDRSQNQTIAEPGQEDYVGLRPDHPMLYGYNLEDVRQEIRTKSSRYHFGEGCVQLYQDRWCFDDLNKNLSLSIHGSTINLYQPKAPGAPQPKVDPALTTTPGISQKINFRSPNEITCRILHQPDECSRVVLNYPNGLTVYYQETHAEQVWYPQETFNGERRRVVVPLGAVIVHYKEDEDHIIRILRHNGEVYDLYQYDPFALEEEGEGGGEFSSREQTSEKEFHLESQSSTGKRLSAREMSRKTSINRHNSLNPEYVDEIAKKKRTSKQQRKNSATEDFDKNEKKPKRKSTSKIKDEDVEVVVVGETSSFGLKSSSEYLKNSIDHEMRFLTMICTMYELSYIHLKVTTAVGRIIHVTKYGAIHETRPLTNVEWHDYFANESYTMREDCVKFIWTKDELKCFHRDGTVITCRTEERYEEGDPVDDLDSLISESSSHEMTNSQLEMSAPDQSQSVLKRNSELGKSNRLTEPKSDPNVSKLTIDPYLGYLMTGEDEEEESKKIPDDPGYIGYQNSNFSLYHKSYATVHFALKRNYIDDVQILMELHTADDMRVRVYEDDTFDLNGEEEEDDIFDYIESEKQFKKKRTTSKTTTASGAKLDAKTSEILDHDQSEKVESEEINMRSYEKLIVRVQIGENLDLKVTKEECEIRAKLLRYDEMENQLRDNLTLGFNFEDNICDVFQDFVQYISEFKNYISQPKDEVYFLKARQDNDTIQGFEFYEELPFEGEFRHVASNMVTDLRAVRTVAELMTLNYDWYENDVAKFPRFPSRARKLKPTPDQKFPRVLSADIYCKIPRQLNNTEEVAKFLEPLDTITFKRTRRHFRTAVEHHLRPHLERDLKRLKSKISWRTRHEEHRVRMFVEQQRKGLYHAMLKHKVYPKYYQFMEKFRGHVKCVDFFEFMKTKCLEKVAAEAVKEAEK